MPVADADIKLRYSGGASNTVADACLGGAISTQAGAVVAGVKNDLFDDVSSAETAAGDVEYRGVYVENTHGSITLEAARIFISAGDSLSDIDIGLAVEAVNVTMATIANESTAPTSVTFTHPVDYTNGLQLNGATGLTAGSERGVWVRRTIAAGTSGQAGYSVTFKIQGDSL